MMWNAWSPLICREDGASLQVYTCYLFSRELLRGYSLFIYNHNVLWSKGKYLPFVLDDYHGLNLKGWLCYKCVFTPSLWPRQAIEVSKRQAKVRETPGNPESVMKLESAETKLQDLKSNMAILGKEAAAAMAAVEAQQQRLTLQRLIAMVMHM